MEIYVDEKYFKSIIENHSNNNKINDFTFYSNDFNFIHDLPKLKHLNFYCKDIFIGNFDLSPLSNIVSIGNDFLAGGDTKLFYINDKLVEINLISLSNVKIIGNSFLKNRKRIRHINLSSLHNLQSIGDSFLYNCSSLTQINLSNLNKLESICFIINR